MNTNSTTSTNLGFSIKMLSLICLLIITYFLKRQLESPTNRSAKQTTTIDQLVIDEQNIRE